MLLESGSKTSAEKKNICVWTNQEGVAFLFLKFLWRLKQTLEQRDPSKGFFFDDLYKWKYNGNGENMKYTL